MACSGGGGPSGRKGLLGHVAERPGGLQGRAGSQVHPCTLLSSSSSTSVAVSAWGQPDRPLRPGPDPDRQTNSPQRRLRRPASRLPPPYPAGHRNRGSRRRPGPRACCPAVVAIAGRAVAGLVGPGGDQLPHTRSPLRCTSPARASPSAGRQRAEASSAGVTGTPWEEWTRTTGP